MPPDKVFHYEVEFPVIAKEKLDYYDARFNEIPSDVLKAAALVVQENIDSDSQKNIAKYFAKRGRQAWIHEVGHHMFGMWFRNKLRHENLKDDRLPAKNWDDYYVAVIEYALGLRDEPSRD